MNLILKKIEVPKLISNSNIFKLMMVLDTSKNFNQIHCTSYIIPSVTMPSLHEFHNLDKDL